MFIILSEISACKNSTGITIADSWKFPNTVESRYIKIGLLQISVKSKFSVNFEITIFSCNEILNRVFLLLIGTIRIKSYNIILTFCHHSLKKLKLQLKKRLTAKESTSLWMATVLIPSRLHVLITRHAISPRLAINILSNVWKKEKKSYLVLKYYILSWKIIKTGRSFCYLSKPGTN